MAKKFKVVLTFDEEVGTYVATVPALYEIASQGATKDEALRNVEEAIAVTIEGLKAIGQAVPSGEVDVSIAEVVVSA
ncbi:MAG: type II toxin-antitoxin system HicB family antitoxin [Syntrophomonas sp.]